MVRSQRRSGVTKGAEQSRGRSCIIRWGKVWASQDSDDGSLGPVPMRSLAQWPKAKKFLRQYPDNQPSAPSKVVCNVGGSYQFWSLRSLQSHIPIHCQPPPQAEEAGIALG